MDDNGTRTTGKAMLPPKVAAPIKDKRKPAWTKRLYDLAFARAVDQVGTVKAKHAAQETIEGSSKHARAKTRRKDYKQYKKTKHLMSKNSKRRNRGGK